MQSYDLQCLLGYTVLNYGWSSRINNDLLFNVIYKCILISVRQNTFI